MSSNPIVKPYSLDKTIVLTTDASNQAIGAILTQENHVVICVSRTLNNAERNYSNIEREALAVVWAVTRLRQFLFGRQFTINTDHKPLLTLFGKNKSIPKGISARICRWAIILMQYDFDIMYVPGNNIAHVDALTRLKFSDINHNKKEDADTELILNVAQFVPSVIDIQSLKQELLTDWSSKKIYNRIISGNWGKCNNFEIPFKQRKDKFTIENGIIYYGTRIYVPHKLRKKVFQVCHNENHSGIQTSINRIKISAWWPGMDRDIESMVKECHTCCNLRPCFSKYNINWPEAKPMQRIHMDWAYNAQIGNVLVVVDAGTGWIEAYICKNRDSSVVISCLQKFFTRFGVPEIVVSDNGKEFISEELNNWLNKQGSGKLESPPYHPQSNGIAERAVQLIKQIIACWNINTVHTSFNTFMQKVLFHYRCTVTSRGQSPAMLVYGRQPRMPIISNFSMGENIIYSNNGQKHMHTSYIMSKGNNTS